LLAGQGIVLAAGAHDALSAKLAEEAGFGAIWASGFGISAVQAVPDANILTLTETLDAVRRIVDAVEIPVIADCDNGYGNAINVMRTAAEFERAGAAGICIEDNELQVFAAAWDRPTPLVAVPTTYGGVSATELCTAGFRMAIFANQALRGAIVAMRETLGEIRRTGRAASVEDRIASLEDVYALV